MESRIIRRLAAALGRRAQPPHGIGDDGALLLPDDGRVVVMDTIVEGTHFRLDWSSLADVAYKALAVNVSDIWAMGAEPRAWLLSLGLPLDRAIDADLSELIDGFSDARSLFAADLALVGGDTIRTPGVSLTVTMIGRETATIRRAGARPGQGVWVNGELGLARGGLTLLERGEPTKAPSLIAAHRRPTPRPFDPELACSRGATAGMDISDGLATDLRRLCAASGCGAEVYTPLPGFRALQHTLGGADSDLLEMQLLGGEDFVHLLASDEQPGPEFQRIGTILEPGLGLTVFDPDGSRHALPEAGFKHFS